MQLENNESTTSVLKFRKTIAIINPIVVVNFFEIIYIWIFIYFLVIRFLKNYLLRLVYINFGLV